MGARVILTALSGPLQGESFRFDEKRLCLLGRSESSTLVIPDHEVSRTHCLLDIRPPQAFIKDLNSTNGTLVNGIQIGSDNPEARTGIQQQTLMTYPLHNGDHIQLPGSEFEIRLIPAAICLHCGHEIPEDQEGEALQAGPWQGWCFSCRMQAEEKQLENPADRLSDTVKLENTSFPAALFSSQQSSTPRKNHRPILQAEQNHTKRIHLDFEALTAGKRAAVSTLKALFTGRRQHSSSSPQETADSGRKPEENFSCTSGRPEFAEHTMFLENPLPESSNLLPIPGYHVIKSIARGGMGEIYLARSTSTGEAAAIKMLLPNLAADDQFKEQFLREAQFLKHMRHPHIIELKDIGRAGNGFYFAMEFCPLGTLEDYLKHENKPLPLKTAVELTLQILEALDYAHHLEWQETTYPEGETVTVHGMVHRDIKPGNIYLTVRDGKLNAKISDFGLAKPFQLAGLTGLTQTGDFAGSLGYLSRQQFLNYRYAKPEVDVWAAAAVMYYMLTLHAPRNFQGRDINDAFSLLPTPIQAFAPDLPDWCQKMLNLALDDYREIHWKTAADFSRALKKAYHDFF